MMGMQTTSYSMLWHIAPLFIIDSGTLVLSIEIKILCQNKMFLSEVIFILKRGLMCTLGARLENPELRDQLENGH